MRLVPEANQKVHEGDRFGMLVVAGVPFYLPVGRRGKCHQFFVAACDCGGVSVVESLNARAGRTISCGCNARRVYAEGMRERATTHGGSHDCLYFVWSSMRARCSNPAHKFFYRYGGRGITVCAEWDTYEPFRDWAIANGYEQGLSIDRKKNHLGYSPDNCEWITRAENTAKMHRDKQAATN